MMIDAGFPSRVQSRTLLGHPPLWCARFLSSFFPSHFTLHTLATRLDRYTHTHTRTQLVQQRHAVFFIVFLYHFFFSWLLLIFFHSCLTIGNKKGMISFFFPSIVEQRIFFYISLVLFFSNKPRRHWDDENRKSWRVRGNKKSNPICSAWATKEEMTIGLVLVPQREELRDVPDWMSVLCVCVCVDVGWERGNERKKAE